MVLEKQIKTGNYKNIQDVRLHLWNVKVNFPWENRAVLSCRKSWGGKDRSKEIPALPK